MSQENFEVNTTSKAEEATAVTKKSDFAASFKTLNFRGGIYAVALCMVAVVLVVIINLVAKKLNVNVDLTETGLYTLHEDTVAYVSEIEDEIILYYFIQSDAVVPEIDNVLERFDGLGKNMKVSAIDPILHPNFAGELVGEEAAATLQFNSVIVVNKTKGRNKLVLATEMITSSVDYTTYTETYTSDVEGQIASALMYVTNEDLPVMYVMSGHNEMDLPAAQKNLILKNNIAMNEYDARSGEEVPEDCDILLINCPSFDFTKTQADTVKAYLSAGGRVLMNVYQPNADFQNLNELINYFGIEMKQGIIFETDSRHYEKNQPIELFPMQGDHEIMENIIEQKRVSVPMASGLSVLKTKRGTITATELLVTTDGAYSKVDTNIGANKTENDIDGPFAVGVCVEETYHGKKAQLLIYSSPYIWDDICLGQSNYGNRELLINSLNYLAEMESAFYAPTQNLNQQVPSWNLTGAQVIFHLAIKLALLPLFCLLVGGVIVFRRRRAK